MPVYKTKIEQWQRKAPKHLQYIYICVWKAKRRALVLSDERVEYLDDSPKMVNSRRSVLLSLLVTMSFALVTGKIQNN